MADRRWQVHAACRGVDPELFFPETPTEPSGDPSSEPGGGPEGEPVVAAQVVAAKAVCRRCPVRARCLAEALERLPHGIAGGLTAGERRRVRAARGLGARRRPRWRVLLDAGSPPTEVAWECGVSVRTVERWAASERATEKATAAGGGSR